MKIHKISSLTLQNFQSIREKTMLPIGGLTLLFGPNSAGKSTIVDALQVFQSLFSKQFEKVTNHLKRWAHRRSGRAGDTGIPCLSLDCYLPPPAFSTGDLWDFLFIDSMSPDLSEALTDSAYVEDITTSGRQIPISIEVSLGSLQSKAGDSDNLTLSVTFDQVPAWSLNEMRLSINLDHPLFASWHGRSDMIDEFSSCIETSYDNGWGSVDDITLLNDRLYRSGGSEDLSKEIRRFLDAGCDLFFYKVSDYLIEYLALDHVKADRATPRADQLTFFYPKEEVQDSEAVCAISAIFDKTKKLTHFDKIAYSGIGHALTSKKKVFFHGMAEDAQDPAQDFINLNIVMKDKWSERVKNPLFSIEKVNDILSQHLFLDNGYIIQPKIFPVINDETTAGYIVNLELKDSHGRSHAFSDVGSGISYVIPVVSAALESRLSIIEEPELHLHPALQSELGDIFIECFNAGNMVIIETHSEHIILRILRRIRETTKGRHGTSGMAIKPEQLSVLYFHPQPDGSTKCHVLRVTAMGEFLDRWPKGFFTERDEDLFDE